MKVNLSIGIGEHKIIGEKVTAMLNRIELNALRNGAEKPATNGEWLTSMMMNIENAQFLMDMKDNWNDEDREVMRELNARHTWWLSVYNQTKVKNALDALIPDGAGLDTFNYWQTI